jgi:hypothetical protein
MAAMSSAPTGDFGSHARKLRGEGIGLAAKPPGPPGSPAELEWTFRSWMAGAARSLTAAPFSSKGQTFMLQYSPRWRTCWCALVLSSFLVAAGCSRTGKVSGKVTYKGQTLKAGTVQFFPEGKGGDYSSPIKEDGSYSISKIPPGPAKIAVVSSTTNPLAGMPPMARGPGAKGMKQAEEQMKKSKEGGGTGASPFEAKQGVSVPAMYGDPEKSGLKVDVTSGSQPFDIKIE